METAVENNPIQIIEGYNNGNISLQDALVELEKERIIMDDILNEIKLFKQKNSDEVSALTKEYKDGYKGFTFEVRNGSKRFSFKNIPEWNEANTNQKNVEKKYKSMFQAKLNGNPHANISEDGEELPLPEVSYGSPSVIVKQKK